MDKFTKLLQLPLKLLQKKEDPHKEYPQFITRIFTGVIDMTLAVLILSPVCALFLSVIYNGLPPSKQIMTIVSNIHKEAEMRSVSSGPSQSALSQEAFEPNPEYVEFMKTRGYSSIFYERLIESAMLCMVIFAFWLFKQATPGKMLLGIKVLDAKTLQTPATYQYVIRILAYVVSVLPFGLGFVCVLFNRQKRSLHDIIAGTVVVKIKYLTV